jgi:hypothetical protein
LFPNLQDMMAAVEGSGAYEGHAEFTGPEGDSKGKLVSNCRTLRTLGWRPKYGVHCHWWWFCWNVVVESVWGMAALGRPCWCAHTREIDPSLCLHISLHGHFLHVAATFSILLPIGHQLAFHSGMCKWWTTCTLCAAGSFEDFMAAGAKDWYSEEQGAVMQGSAHA